MGLQNGVALASLVLFAVASTMGCAAAEEGEDGSSAAMTGLPGPAYEKAKEQQRKNEQQALEERRRGNDVAVQEFVDRDWLLATYARADAAYLVPDTLCAGSRRPLTAYAWSAWRGRGDDGGDALEFKRRATRTLRRA